jgi:Na+-translocating ferredoxin:NAD+ oxidoreductase RnfD subunit
MKKTPKTLSFSPISKKMIFLIISLFLLWISSVIIFGFHVLWLGLTVMITQLGFEALFAYHRRKPVDEGLLYNALILLMILPPSLPLWMAAVGTAFAAVFGKLVFGGYPRYVFNPALVGYLFLTISFPSQMNTQWLNPLTNQVGTGLPIITWLNQGDIFSLYSLQNLFLGFTPGLLGEVSRGLIFILAIGLIASKTIDWRAPVSFLGSLFIIAFIGQLLNDGPIAWIGLMVGNVVFASIFLVSDKPTLPVTGNARFAYGFVLAFFTVIIRRFAAWPEGVLFALVLTNALSPLIDSLFAKKSVSDVTTNSLEEVA